MNSSMRATLKIGTSHDDVLASSQRTQIISPVQISINVIMAPDLHRALLDRFLMNRRIMMKIINRPYAVRVKPTATVGGNLNISEFG